MADQTLEILIRVLGDTTKAKEVHAELQKVTTATMAAGRESEQHTRKISGLDRALGLLARQFGVVGQLVTFAFKDPVSLLVAGLALGLRSVSNAAAGLSERMKTLAESTGAAFGDMSGTLRQNTIQFIQSNQSLKQAQDELETKIKAVTSAIESQRDAALELLDARKAIDLAGAASDDEKKAVAERYKAAEAEIKQRATAETIAARQAELDKLRLQLAEQMRRMGGMSAAQIQDQVTDLPKKMASAQAEQQAAKAALDEFQSLMASPTGAAALLTQYGTFQGVATVQESLSNRSQAANSAVRRLQRTEENLAFKSGAVSAAEDLRKQISTRETELSGMKTRYNAAWQARAIEADGAPASLLLNAAGGADALRAGAKSIPNEQARAIAEATTALGLVGQNNQTILRILSSLNDDIKNLKQGLQKASFQLQRHPQ